MERFNRLFTRRSAAVPEAEFLVVAAQHADKVYNHAFRELLRQVSTARARPGCMQRPKLSSAPCFLTLREWVQAAAYFLSCNSERVHTR